LYVSGQCASPHTESVNWSEGVPGLTAGGRPQMAGNGEHEAEQGLAPGPR
jgi:hypothetical protein